MSWCHDQHHVVLASCVLVMGSDAGCPCCGHTPAGIETELLPQDGKVLACMQLARVALER